MSLLEARGNSALGRARREIATAGRNVWLAGLGAVAEVGDGSRELFDRLVEMGRPYEVRRKAATDTLLEKTGKVAREIGQLMQDTAVYEGRKVLKRLPIMTREDVAALGTRLDSLAAKLDAAAVVAAAPAVKAIEIATNPIAGQGETAPEPRQRRTAKR